MTAIKEKMDFNNLVKSIRQINDYLVEQAGKAVNVSLTLRNWIIGNYIEEYEREGTDRANYGDHLMDDLANTLTQKGLSRCDRRELYRYRSFYLTYPQIVETVPPQLISTHQIETHAAMEKVETLSPQLQLQGRRLVENLSFSHFSELIAIEDRLKRSFYEIECIRGNWSVRELRRQIASLYYERSGLSTDKKKLAEHIQFNAERNSTSLVVRDPYVFEFLGIKPKEVMHESDLEDSLLDKLQDFLLELGRGFCFEARQKRILIGGEYYFVDLVFYHRILKCHILVELKVDGFSHEYIGQLNTYVNWYRENESTEGDQLPIGILLCTEKNQALVEFATAGMDNQLFVSKYKLELPKKAAIRRFLEKEMEDAGIKPTESPKRK